MEDLNSNQHIGVKSPRVAYVSRTTWSARRLVFAMHTERMLAKVNSEPVHITY
jgi:hypothetical protein